ncbi:MAG: transposase [Planctomycetaceae bacterium]|nr:transposase [Planctomycetaceae bacterium]
MLISLLSWPPRRRPNTTGSRTAPKPFLSDSQWLLIADLFPDPQVGPQGGRPRVNPRDCLEGILWVLITGARWKDLPERYPSPCTCWRRHRDWTRSGVFRAAWDRLLGKMLHQRGLDWETAIGDGSFSRAKKGGVTWDVVSVETALACS